ncbi:hypothetical protein BCR36DRAFT_416145 [Piromyces finnis]|uniref:Uncharacterized protein n=1 Tax=Piromyces finnis TaxID=1754191 RepID=A0A1Y1UWF8_9FUNG|nr:hypothetical protein BCR36DRAFT_416145 [Piromyces finnis]|eukprot:ORX42401.1 hypothetical protein BCR36DRAFT_416145 [Piromyces finnis]
MGKDSSSDNPYSRFLMPEVPSFFKILNDAASFASAVASTFSTTNITNTTNTTNGNIIDLEAYEKEKEKEKENLEDYEEENIKRKQKNSNKHEYRYEYGGKDKDKGKDKDEDEEPQIITSIIISYISDEIKVNLMPSENGNKRKQPDDSQENKNKSFQREVIKKTILL